jgi:hypothetical protein
MASAADLKRTLSSLGLDFLFDILNRANIDPTIDVSDENQLANYIDANPDAQTYMKERFKGNEYRIQNGLRPLKPSEYVDQEQAYLQRLKDNGLPVGFYDSPADLAKLIGGDVGVTEFDARIRQGYQAAMKAPQAVKNQLQQLYGVTDQELAAYFLDPTRAADIMGRKKSADLFGRQIEAAQIAAQGQTQAGMQINAQTAEELAAQGVSASMAETGFSQIRDQQQLFQTNIGEEDISQQEQISGTFGTNAQARQAIANRKRSRKAAFESGGSLGLSQTGVTGLGTAGQ